MDDRLARFRAHFDSFCENCGDAILDLDDMAFDKQEQEYICDDCADQRSFDRIGEDDE